MSGVVRDWVTTSVGEVCEFKYGKSLPASARSGGSIPVFGSNGIVGGHDAALTHGPTIIIGRKGSYGEVNFSPVSCWPIDTTYYVDATATTADLRWLALRLTNAGLNQMNRAAAVPGLNREDAYRVQILLPPLPEQRRIAAILDQAETLRTQRRAALAQLDSLTQSLFLDMFGDPVTNPMGWLAQTLDEVTNKVTDGEHINPSFSEQGMPIVMAGNVLADKIDLESAKRVEESLGHRFRKKCGPEFGDLLIVGRGATIGRLCRVNVSDTFCLMGSVILVKPDPTLLDGRFLCGLLALPAMHAKLYKTSGSSAQQAIYLKDVKKLACPLPPLPLQQTFATRVQAIEALKAKHRAALTELDALFASLQHRAFNGELTAQASTKSKLRSFAELGQLISSKGLEALVYAARRLPNHGHYWPLKAQYVADRRHLERHGRTLYGETHVAMPYGPVPQAAYNASRALANGELICEFPMDAVRAALRRDGETLVALRDADPGVLDAEERESLDWAIRLVADLSFEELKTQTHDAAWEKTPRNEPMAWQDIVATLDPAARQRLMEQFE